MTTKFNNSWVSPWEPVRVELWSYQGKLLGMVGDYEDMTFTFNDREADTAEILAPLTSLTSTLVPCDGRVLVSMRIGGRTHLSTPVTAEVTAGNDPAQAMVKVVTAGGWTLLDGELLPPSLDTPLNQQTTPEFDVNGPLETVIKRLLEVGVSRTKHPVVVLQDKARGPYVRATGKWETVGDTVKDLLHKTGYRLDLTGWIPGDKPPQEDLSLTRPSIIADVIPYERRDGLVWTVDAGDITDWSISHTRPTATAGIIGYETDNPAKRVYGTMTAPQSGSPWEVREIFKEYTTHKEIDDRDPDPQRVWEGMQNEGRLLIEQSGATMEADITVDISTLWEFNTNKANPRSFDVGDWVEVRLPVLGKYTQVIKAVEVHVTPTDFVIRPVIGTPDTADSDLYSSLTDLSRRVGKLERK